MAGRRAADRPASGCCACSNISVMQLFHELKQQFPALPDRLVSDCASAHCHDRPLCARLLRRAAADMTQAAYPAQALRRAPDPPPLSQQQGTPQRPNTLQFAPAAPAHAPHRPSRHAPPPPLPLPPQNRQEETIEEQYPVNLSLDLNCSGGHSRNPLRTSVNVTVRTPVGSPHQHTTSCAPTTHQHHHAQHPPASHHQQSQGFQSRLHITVSPSSATHPHLGAPPRRPRSYYGPLIPEPPVTAPRVVRAESLPNVLADLAPQLANTVQKQLERKHRLESELEAERSRLRAIEREVRALEGPAVSQGPGRALILKQEIKTLQSECFVLAQRVDQYTGGPIPLGETSEEFYQNIYTGQQLHVPGSRRRRREPPPRPPPPRLADGRPWTCHLCTFRNHPLLNKCEQCEMPRILRGTTSPDIENATNNKLETVSHINTGMASLNCADQLT